MNTNLNGKRKTRLRLSKTGKILIIGIIVFIIVVFYLVKTITYCMSDEYKIGEMGYNDAEVATILSKTEKNLSEREKIKKLRYNKLIPKLLNEKFFMFQNLERYLKYAHKNSDESLKNVVAKVNVKRDYDFYTHVKNTDVSKKELILVNKYNKLSKSFVPNQLVEISNQYAYDDNKTSKITYEAYRSMWNAAKKDGCTLIVTSSYRDYDAQEEVWNSIENTSGEEAADSKAARAGHSEHQTGLALDIVTYNSYNNEFENTKEFKWLQKNAHKYGFILRFPKGKEDITGYNYESWHYRYVGKEIAEKIRNLGITYDEYYAYYLEK